MAAHLNWDCLLKNMYQVSIFATLIGSEGTLGVITSANLSSSFLSQKTLTGMFAFKSEAAALKAVVGLFKVGVSPPSWSFLIASP